MTIQDKIELITDRISRTYLTGKAKYNKMAKEQLIEFYTVTSVDRLKEVSAQDIKDYNFADNLNTNAARLERADNIEKVVVKLETHDYSPELNKLHLKNGRTYNTPHLTELDKAIKYAAYHMTDQDLHLLLTFER